MLLDSSRHGKYVGVEDNVLRLEAHLFGQNAVRTLADADLALDCVGLPLLIERHYYDGGPIPAYDSCLPDEFLFSLL